LNPSGQKGEPLRRYGLVGYPVSHSLTPAVFNAAFKAAGITARYDLYPVLPQDLAEAIPKLLAGGVMGFNVTLPHKTAVLPLMENLDASSILTGAVNTVVLTREGLAGYNTDMDGFRDSFGPLGVPEVGGATVLVLGAGGAARAVVAVLGQEGASRIVIANRFMEETRALLATLAPAFPGVAFEAVGLFDRALVRLSAEAVLCVQATSLGLGKGDPLPLDPACLPEGCFVYDLVYLTDATPFVGKAMSLGYKAADGKEMALRQADRNFFLWTGEEAPSDAMRRGMEREMKQRSRAEKEAKERGGAVPASRTP